MKSYFVRKTWRRRQRAYKCQARRLEVYSRHLCKWFLAYFFFFYPYASLPTHLTHSGEGGVETKTEQTRTGIWGRFIFSPAQRVRSNGTKWRWDAKKNSSTHNNIDLHDDEPLRITAHCLCLPVQNGMRLRGLNAHREANELLMKSWGTGRQKQWATDNAQRRARGVGKKFRIIKNDGRTPKYYRSTVSVWKRSIPWYDATDNCRRQRSQTRKYSGASQSIQQRFRLLHNSYNVTRPPIRLKPYDLV